jgi:hypothetical protein
MEKKLVLNLNSVKVHRLNIVQILWSNLYGNQLHLIGIILSNVKKEFILRHKFILECNRH